jgi:6-pyruvoyltetrahydropterin/6-carboxytetrahydropterin synthase
MHGHSYRVELQVEGPIQQPSGFVIDFFDIEEVFRRLLDRLDHRCLNDVEGLENPTAENIAIWIWDRTRPALPGLSSVRVYETATVGRNTTGPNGDGNPMIALTISPVC